MRKKLLLILSIFVVSLPFYSNAQTTEQFTPSQDNTIHSESNNSNGLGPLFSGRTNRDNKLRRVLIKFDVSSIPTDATITEATLTLSISRAQNGTDTYNIFELTKDWGEGTSSIITNAGNGTTAVAPDATWSDAMLGTSNWTTAGGDFINTPLSTVSMTGFGSHTFPTSTDFVITVQKWVDDTSTNHGIILIGDETTDGTTRQFASKDTASGGVSAPTLSVTYNTLSTEEFSLNNFSITPNPAESTITLELPNIVKQANVNIYNVLGKTVYSSTYMPQSSIDISSLNSGVYLIKVNTEGSTKTKRFIKI